MKSLEILQDIPCICQSFSEIPDLLLMFTHLDWLERVKGLFPIILHEYLDHPLRTRLEQVSNLDSILPSLAGRALLIRSRLELGLAPSLHGLTLSDRGKPCLADVKDFSITHSGALVCLGLSQRRRLGLDCEPKPFSGYQDLWVFFHHEELESINNNVAPEHETIRLWTRKEALLKASGIGITDSLQKINSLPNLLDMNNTKWKIEDLAWHQDYFVELCWEQLPDQY